MPNTIRYFRDALTIDQTLISTLNAFGGDTLVLGARELALVSLSPNFNYIIAADHLTASAAIVLAGQDGNPSLSVTVLESRIDGALNLTCAGMPGEKGADGEPGESGITDNPEGGRPIVLPGGAGGPGENGEAGAPGGNLTISYTSAGVTPVGSSPGGRGGAGGAGGPGGAGRPAGKRGAPGRPGMNGATGLVNIRKVASAEVWSLLDARSAREWAEYRAEVAGYLLRKYDCESQLAALGETQGALILNPADPDAATIQSRIANRQIPSGLPRDLDIALLSRS